MRNRKTASKSSMTRRQRGVMLLGLMVAVGIIGSIGGLLTTSIFQFSRSSATNGAHNEVSVEATRASRWLTRDIRMHATTDVPQTGTVDTATFTHLSSGSGEVSCTYSLSGTDLMRSCNGMSQVTGNNIENLGFTRLGSSIQVSFDVVSSTISDVREQFDLLLSSDVSPEVVDELNLIDGEPEQSLIPMQVLDFETDSEGETLEWGEEIDDEWEDHGIHISVDNTNGTGPMLFGTENPTGGDKDLGAPHTDFGGKGVGHGGASGQPGQNNGWLGNVLIISEDGDDDDPDDNGSGGTLVFTFDTPVSICSVGILDIEEPFGTIETLDAEGERIALDSILNYGDNSVQTVMIEQHGVSELRVNLPGSGSVTQVAFDCGV